MHLTRLADDEAAIAVVALQDGGSHQRHARIPKGRKLPAVKGFELVEDQASGELCSAAGQRAVPAVEHPGRMTSVTPPDRLLRSGLQYAVLNQEALQLLPVCGNLRQATGHGALPFTDGIVGGQVKSPFAERSLRSEKSSRAIAFFASDPSRRPAVRAP